MVERDGLPQILQWGYFAMQSGQKIEPSLNLTYWSRTGLPQSEQLDDDSMKAGVKTINIRVIIIRRRIIINILIRLI
jgi:hypothetical protein